MRMSVIRRLPVILGLLGLAVTAQAQNRERTWEFDAGLLFSGSLDLSGEQGTGLDIDDDLGFTLGGTYNFTNRFALGFGFGWLSPDYTATYVPEDGLPNQTESLRAEMDVFSLYGKGTFNFIEGPITPFVEATLGWTAVDSNIADGPPVTGCWWDPWWGYICSSFYDTYSEDLTSWSYAAGVRWDVNRMWGLKASYGVFELDTSSRTEDASIDMFTIQAIFRY